MSKDITVLTPAGRRQIVHCTPDTTILQILEDVCLAQGFEASEYDLKHHKKIMDLTTTVRFSNLPNKAMLEMVETDRKREEANVIVGLQLEDGERRTAEFPPNTNLYDLLISLAPKEISAFQQPCVLYMRQEVTGVPALREKTLRQLGLIRGRAILRLLNKMEESRQANVSAVYAIPIKPDATKKMKPIQTDNTTKKMKPIETDNTTKEMDVDASVSNTQASVPGPSCGFKDDQKFDPIRALKELKNPQQTTATKEENQVESDLNEDMSQEAPRPSKPLKGIQTASSTSSVESEKCLERRLRIEEEVIFLGAQKAVAFMPEDSEHELSDLPDDFYELTIEEVRKLYKDLQQNRIELENTPLATSNQRQQLECQVNERSLAGYKNAVVRVQFPDHMILQGIFLPSNTIRDVTAFIKEHLRTPEKPFHIFTTPLKESLDPNMTLLEAKFVPCVLMHFKWLDDSAGSQACLKEEIYLKQTTSDAATILASKYRAPSRRKLEEASCSSQNKQTSSTKTSKVPKWFKT